MANDADGTDNNDVCTPVVRPAFAVGKSTTDKPVVLAMGATNTSVTYQVTVTNTSDNAGTFSPITEVSMGTWRQP